MTAVRPDELATLRAVVGYLGERSNFGWWQSAFFSSSSQAFLQPIFARTLVAARCNGVTAAASLVHDERIGVGQVYHLFRLPEDLEQAMHRTLHDQAFGEKLAVVCASKQAALDHLESLGGVASRSVIGPTRIGSAGDLRDLHSWRSAAAHYLRACNESVEVYPYFADSQ